MWLVNLGSRDRTTLKTYDAYEGASVEGGFDPLPLCSQWAFYTRILVHCRLPCYGITSYDITITQFFRRARKRSTKHLHHATSCTTQ
jgi:hypothetical protein